MTDGASCYLCGKEMLHAMRSFPWLVNCSGCGLIYRPDRLASASDVSANLYDEQNTRHRMRIQEVTLRIAADRWRWLSRRLPRKGGQLLEIGCGTGEFLVAARTDGWGVQGSELSQSFREAARDWYDLDIRPDDLTEDPSNLAAQFDVVAMLHVFEHLPDPLKFLRRTYRLLKTDGWLFIVTPNAQSWTDRLLGTRNPTFLKPDHYFHYNLHTMTAVTHRCGFDAVDLTSYEPRHHLWTSLYGMLGSIRGASPNAPTRPRAGGQASATRRAVSNSPYWIGEATSFLTAPLRDWLQRSGQGHELYTFCRKSARGLGNS